MEIDGAPDDVLAKRADMRESNAAEQSRTKKISSRIAARTVPREWPVYASTLQPAALDPAEVKAPPLPAPPSMETLRKQAEACVPGTDDAAGAEREHRQSADHRAELAKESRLFGPWTVERVDDWLVEMNTVLIRLPMETKPRGYTGGLRRVVTEFQDLVAREENRSVRSMRNAVAHRWGGLTMAQCRRADNSMWWCAAYLKHEPELARLVGLGARWKALGAPVTRKCRQLRIGPTHFYKRRRQGLELIAACLTRDKVKQ